MKIIHLILFLTLFCSLARGQISFSCHAENINNGEPLPGISITVPGTNLGTFSDNSGNAIIKNIPGGKHVFVFSGIGFTDFILELVFPLKFPDSVYRIRLTPDEKELEQVIVSSSRTDSRIENTPTRVEVLGSEEVEEESGVKPSHVASLLGDVAGIQTQQTSAVTGSTNLRIQGLPGDYTQILRDGMPLFGGYSGSFSLLQIPPLDLKQVEIIKGASSTLYGGGAIAGMINIISKKPIFGKKERSLLLNQSTLKESNIHIYLSERDKKRGFTFFGGLNYQKQADVDKDGFSDVPTTESFFLHPTLFFYPNEKNTISVGINSIIEDRRGGDMKVLIHQPDSTHRFYIENESYRNTIYTNWENRINTKTTFSAKGTVSSYIRNISTNVYGMKARQFSYFTEASLVRKSVKHDIVAGMNFSGEIFKKKLPDSSQISDYRYFTLGIFVQDDWRMNSKFILESGLRNDFHNQYGSYFLPRISLLYKITPSLTTRAGGGLGYKIPSVFESERDEREYRKLRLDSNAVAERSAGLNLDLNWKKTLGDVKLVVNQSFFITEIRHPLVAKVMPGFVSYFNETQPVVTRGFETWVQLRWEELEMYMGYTLTDARKKYDAANPYLEFSARNKFASVISYEFSKRMRACIEASYTGKQYLDGGKQNTGFPIFAAMIRYDIRRCSFVLNGENLFDYRQNKKEIIISPPVTNPAFKQLWGPIDGRIINLSLKVSL